MYSGILITNTSEALAYKRAKPLRDKANYQSTVIANLAMLALVSDIIYLIFRGINLLDVDSQLGFLLLLFYKITVEPVLDIKNWYFSSKIHF